MAQIGTIRLETQNNGTVSVPVFDTGDSGSNVYEFVRVQTAGGTGFIPVVDPADASYPYLRVQSQNQGVVAVNDTATLSVDLSQEEDGNISEWTGDTGQYSTTTSPTISGSTYSIAYGNDSTDRYIENTFNAQQYDRFVFHIYISGQANNEVIFVDSSNGNVIFCIYHREFNDSESEPEGIYYSSADGDTTGSITNAGSTGVRENGTELIGNISGAKWWEIEFFNIDWTNETLDIAVDGTTQVTNEPFILSGVPDILQLSSNKGTSDPADGFFDEAIAYR